MFEQVRRAYHRSLAARLVAYAVLLIYGAMLFVFAGGFPPWAWRFLVITVPQIPALLHARGIVVLVPLLGLVLLSLALLVLWCVFVTAWLHIFLSGYQDWQASRHAAYEEPEVDETTEETVGGSVPQEWLTPYAPQQVQRVSNIQHLHHMSSELNAVVRERVPSVPLVRQVVGGMSTQHNTFYPVPPLAQVRTRNEPVTPLPANKLDTHNNGARPIPQRTHAVMRTPLHVMPSVYEEEDELEEQDTRPYAEDAEDVENFATLPLLEDGDGLLMAEVPENREGANVHAEQEERLRFTSGIASDAGIVRKDQPNEDNLLAIQGSCIMTDGPQPVGLFVVADGMGGHANGREASRLAIQAFSDVVVPAMLRSIDDEEILVDMLKDGVHRANLSIYQRNRGQEGIMGTTITAVLLVGAKAYIANVGDSRTYIYKGEENTLAQVTRDHSHVALLVEKGAITREDIYTHPKRNQIYRCLGEHASVQIDLFQETLAVGDALLLCSDGLWEMVRDPILEKIMRTTASRPAYASASLIEAALHAGGADNVSAVVVVVGTGA